MGYDTHIIIGRLDPHPLPEREKNLNKPYADGSGFETLLDEEGNEVFTGRVRFYFNTYAEMDMCKIYDSHLSKLHDRYKRTPMLKKNGFVEVYMKDGNTSFEEDAYGDSLVVVPFFETLAAARKDVERDGGEYRRYGWIKGMLESMRESEKELTCIFYGS